MGFKSTCIWCGIRYDEEETRRGPNGEGPFCSGKCRHEYLEAHSGRDRAAEARASASAAAKSAAEAERRRTLAEIDERFEEERRAREAERKRDPKNWYGNEWAEHLVKHPEDAFQCDWSKLKGADIVEVLLAHSQIVPKEIEWAPRLNGADWSRLLRRYPIYAAKCSWDKLDGTDWSKLLIQHPELSTNCSWGRLSGEDWAALLVKRPEFSEHCAWNKLSSKDNRIVLEAHPEFIKKCTLPNISGNSWAKLLLVQPQLAEYCDKWKDVDGDMWCDLLMKHPQFADKCDFSKIKVSQWDKLIGKHKEFADKYPWSDDPVEDLKKICNNTAHNLAELFDWSRLGEYHSGEDPRGLQTIIDGLTLSAWVNMADSKWYYDCIYSNYIRDWDKHPVDFSTVEEGDIVRFLNTFHGVNYWRSVNLNRLSAYTRARILQKIDYQDLLEQDAFFNEIKTDDFCLTDWIIASLSDPVEAGFPEEKRCRCMWLAIALHNVGNGDDIWKNVESHCDESEFTPWDWGCLYGAIRTGKRWQDHWEEAIRSLDKHFDDSDYEVSEWADFLIGFGGRYSSASSIDELMGDLTGSVAKRFLKKASKFDFSTLPDEKKILLSLSRVNLLDYFHIAKPTSVGSDELKNKLQIDQLSVHQKFYLIARYPSLSQGVQRTGFGCEKSDSEFDLRLCFPEVIFDGDWESNIDLYELSVLSDEESQNVLKSFPKLEHRLQCSEGYKGKDPESNESAKPEKKSKGGCLWKVVKLALIGFIIWLGLCVGLSYVNSDVVPESARPTIVTLSQTGNNIRAKVSELCNKAQSSFDKDDEAKCQIDGGSQAESASTGPVAEDRSDLWSKIKYGAIIVGAIVVLFLLRMLLPGLAEGGVIAFVGRVAVLGWCSYKTGIVAIGAHNFPTAAVMLLVALWVLVMVCRGKSRPGWWRWLLLAGCYSAGLTDLTSFAIAGAVALILGPAKLK